MFREIVIHRHKGENFASPGRQITRDMYFEETNAVEICCNPRPYAEEAERMINDALSRSGQPPLDLYDAFSLFECNYLVLVGEPKAFYFQDEAESLIKEAQLKALHLSDLCYAKPNFPGFEFNQFENGDISITNNKLLMATVNKDKQCHLCGEPIWQWGVCKPCHDKIEAEQEAAEAIPDPYESKRRKYRHPSDDCICEGRGCVRCEPRRFIA